MADVSQIKLPNGSVYDLIDEKSGYITAEYIENKTDYEIPVSRVGEIVVGETAIGTDSTNFPTSKAVVDYVDERVVQEIEAINIPTVPTKTSDLMNDSEFISQFVITLTREYDAIADDYVWTMDKTMTEINTAYNAGKKLVCKIADFVYIPLKSASYYTDHFDYYFEMVTFPYSNSIGANQVSILYNSFNENLTITVSDYLITPVTPNSGCVIPTGGTTGQVLMKTNNYDYGFAWTDLPIYNGTVE